MFYFRPKEDYMDNLFKLNNAIVDGLLEQKAEVISEGILLDGYFEELQQIKKVILKNYIIHFYQCQGSGGYHLDFIVRDLETNQDVITLLQSKDPEYFFLDEILNDEKPLEDELSKEYDPLKEWIINKLYDFAAKHGI